MTDPKKIPAAYYRFDQYIDRGRMTTFWYQIKEISGLDVTSVLEVGVGTSLVSSVLRGWGYEVTSVDINASLNPDYVGDVLHLSDVVKDERPDLVLCARVLHHLPFENLDIALREIRDATRRYAVITLPQDTIRLYLGAKVTSRDVRWISIPFPLFVKRLWIRLWSADNSYYNKLWKVGSGAQTSTAAISSKINQYFQIHEDYALPEDCSHRVYVLEKR